VGFFWGCEIFGSGNKNNNVVLKCTKGIFWKNKKIKIEVQKSPYLDNEFLSRQIKAAFAG
jgi:hypothetical protein